MPDVTQAEIGRRMYHVHREKRGEHAVKLMQGALGPEWRSLKEEEIIILGHVLQCTWNTIDQKQWDGIPFGKVQRVRCSWRWSAGSCPVAKGSARDAIRHRRRWRRSGRSCRGSGNRSWNGSGPGDRRGYSRVSVRYPAG